MEVKVSRVHPDANLPEYKTAGAACFDLETIEEATIKPNEIIDLRTGLVFCVPVGYVMIVQPRSSSPKLGYDMPHSVGVIDSDYCGPKDELMLRLHNFTDKPIIIKKYQRVAQGYIIPLPKVVFKEYPPQKLKKTSRGGFGSTG